MYAVEHRSIVGCILKRNKFYTIFPLLQSYSESQLLVVWDEVSHVYLGKIVCSHVYLTCTVGTSLNSPGQCHLHNSFGLTTDRLSVGTTQKLKYPIATSLTKN